MHLSLAVKLAWANTTNNWQRLLVRCSGVTFAVVLMFMQTGFRNALFDSNVRMMEEKITTDIVLRIKSRFMMSSGQQLALRKVIAARSCQGVRSHAIRVFEIFEQSLQRLCPGRTAQAARAPLTSSAAAIRAPAMKSRSDF